jgi:hypothetical protein
MTYTEAVVHFVLPAIFAQDWKGLASEQESVVLEEGETHPDWGQYSFRRREREKQIARAERWLLLHDLVDERRSGKRVQAVPLRKALADAGYSLDRQETEKAQEEFVCLPAGAGAVTTKAAVGESAAGHPAHLTLEREIHDAPPTLYEQQNEIPPSSPLAELPVMGQPDGTPTMLGTNKEVPPNESNTASRKVIEAVKRRLEMSGNARTQPWERFCDIAKIAKFHGARVGLATGRSDVGPPIWPIWPNSWPKCHFDGQRDAPDVFAINPWEDDECDWTLLQQTEQSPRLSANFAR